jgi:hypothetical protein
MVTVIPYADLTTTTPVTNVVLRGDVDVNDLEMFYVNKETGSGKAINRGYVLALTNTVTPNAYVIATAGDKRPLVVSGPASFTWDWEKPTQSAGDDDPTIQVIKEGRVVLKAGGAIQPGAKVQAAANGEVVNWDGTAGKDCGVFIGKPGTFGGNVTKGAAAQNDLIWVDFEGTGG